MFQNLIIALSCVAGFTALILWFLDKPKRKVEIQKSEVDIEKSKADIQKIISDQLLEVNEFLNEEKERIIKKFREEKNELLNKIDSLLKVTKQLKKDYEGLKYSNAATELEIKHFKKHIDFSLLKKEKVYLLDDDPFISEEFQKRFDKLSIIDFKSFIDNDKYTDTVRLDKPGTLIIDYKLEGGKTAEDIIREIRNIIKEIRYEPKKFIISGSDFYKERFKNTNIQFYVKDDYYVDDIAIEVLQHLIDKD